MVFSLLLHMLVFYSFIFLLQLNKPKPEEKKAASLQVRLILPLPLKVQPKPDIKLLSTPAPSEHKVAQTPTKPIPDANLKPPAPIVAQAAAGEGRRVQRALEAVGRFGSGHRDVSRRHDAHLAEAFRR